MASLFVINVAPSADIVPSTGRKNFVKAASEKGAYSSPFSLSFLMMTQEAFVDRVDQGQTAQNVQSGL